MLIVSEEHLNMCDFTHGDPYVPLKHGAHQEGREKQEDDPDPRAYKSVLPTALDVSATEVSNPIVRHLSGAYESRRLTPMGERKETKDRPASIKAKKQYSFPILHSQHAFQGKLGYNAQKTRMRPLKMCCFFAPEKVSRHLNALAASSSARS